MNDFKKYQSNKDPSPPYSRPSNDRYDVQDEESDEDVDMIRSRIGEVKQDSLNTTRKALEQIKKTEAVAAKTLDTLGQQSAQLNKIDKTVDVTNVRADESINKTSNLRTLNKSIFSFSIGNPFNSKKKREAELEKARLAQEHSIHESERIRAQNYESKKRLEDAANYKKIGRGRNPDRQLSKEERDKYTFDEDEDPEIENEINDNLNEISDVVGGLKKMALGMGQEIETQNAQLNRIQMKTDDTSAKIAISQHHLRKIK
ncbi:Protein transport protein sec9 [Smittium mucronatum]|uniref:Protein transport protein sec9 n=1 Tax=Smittium mucronatum TaxID=133383 RepID=A0A1R0GQA1_9FUNG|nr:Protein transport protein sec9 [Smittium mucronatum]